MGRQVPSFPFFVMLSLLATTLAASPLVPAAPASTNPIATFTVSGGATGTFKNLVTGGDETRSNGGNIQEELISQDSNVAGTIAMANTGQPNSGGSQVFFNVADNANL